MALNIVKWNLWQDFGKGWLLTGPRTQLQIVVMVRLAASLSTASMCSWSSSLWLSYRALDQMKWEWRSKRCEGVKVLSKISWKLQERGIRVSTRLLHLEIITTNRTIQDFWQVSFSKPNLSRRPEEAQYHFDTTAFSMASFTSLRWCVA